MDIAVVASIKTHRYRYIDTDTGVGKLYIAYTSVHDGVQLKLHVKLDASVHVQCVCPQARIAVRLFP